LVRSIEAYPEVPSLLRLLKRELAEDRYGENPHGGDGGQGSEERTAEQDKLKDGEGLKENKVSYDNLLEKAEGESFKVAIGYDPEDDPSPLFEYSFHLASLLCGEVIIVHALEGLLDTETGEEEEVITKRIEEVVKSLPEEIKKGVPYSVEIVYGKDIETFTQFVEKYEVKLFSFYFYKKLLGRTLSQEFLEHLPTGLLIVKEGIPFRFIRRIIVPLDFSKNSFKQKEFVERLKECTPYGLEIEFLHVMDEENESEEEEIKLLFNELFEENDKFIILHGDPAKEIVKRIKEGSYDLVVVGRVGKGLNIGYGNVTKEILEEAKCPVVVL